MAGLWFDPSFDRARSGAEAPFVPLAERTIGSFDPSRLDLSPGRRLRVFATLVHCVDPVTGAVALRDTHHPFLVPDQPTSYGDLLQRVENEDGLAEVRQTLDTLPLRLGQPRPLLTALPEEHQWTARDPDLPPALQDLGDEVNEDVREALFAYDNPGRYYPGIDAGIDPVPDEHVKLVIWALQRELNRELRPQEGHYGGSPPLPAAPLAQLPWDIQRAVVERRRWRYGQWGIGRAEWECGVWSLWRVPLDPDYVPRRAQRLSPAAA
ncbi:MAG: hypothetical protein IT304_09900 [Dehalococcoidia bacterium]|nr:hypothetical protein [Dehalococcoidia bacterium]